ncbi:MAG: hypothetical protein Q8N31_13530 [Reyranella sp.]|nr:hypothetical protein [Reyranella sp.]
MTYMATIGDLENAGKLIGHDADLESHEFPTRWIHLAPQALAWLTTVLPSESADGGRKISPYEQVEQIFYEYVIGRPMAYARDRKKLNPVGYHVWEFKTPDARLFGWLPKRRHFIVVCGQMKRHLTNNKDYAPYVEKVVHFRSTLDLDEPKFLTGVLPNDIC